MKVIITGSTGMVGQAVLIECLESPLITEVLVINRSSLNKTHPKLKEILLKGFGQVETIAKDLRGYDACFHCMGVSAVGMTEEDYAKITFGYTKLLVDVLHQLNPQMVVNYVSGTNTDSSESGNTMWSRVKGKTENYILNKGFKDAYAFRPGAIIPEKGVKSKTKLYNFLYVITKPLNPLLKRMKSMTTSSKLGKAMINSILYPQDLKHLENVDINKLANK